MVGAAGLEPATLCLEGRCSIHLSYAPSRLTDLRRRACDFKHTCERGRRVRPTPSLPEAHEFCEHVTRHLTGPRRESALVPTSTRSVVPSPFVTVTAGSC